VRLEISIAGFLASWEFPGSRGFESWARDRPWLSQGGLCSIRVGCDTAPELFYPSACSVMRAMNGDARAMAIQFIECHPALGSPVEALLSALGVQPDLNPFQAKEVLSKRLMDQPLVVVLAERQKVDARGWYELALLIEYFGKSAPAVPLSVVVLDRRGVVAQEPAFDFVAGRCTHLVLAHAAGMTESIIWQSYLHHRACWEAAGNPEAAQVVGDQLSLVQLGNETEVERVLRDCASAAAERMNLDSLKPMILKTFSRARGDERESARQTLQAAGALWRPPGLQRLELAPWASRHLLSTSWLPDDLVPRLRHNLVCTPIASEILTHCLNAESKIRMQLTGKQVKQPSDRTIAAHERFRAGIVGFADYPTHYPRPPTRPQDVWAFAALGETMFACSESDVGTKLWETVNLRNAVAHGDYITWTHVVSALQQLRRFDN
jgi:hypothetical protein